MSAYTLIAQFNNQMTTHITKTFRCTTFFEPHISFGILTYCFYSILSTGSFKNNSLSIRVIPLGTRENKLPKSPTKMRLEMLFLIRNLDCLKVPVQASVIHSHFPDQDYKHSSICFHKLPDHQTKFQTQTLLSTDILSTSIPLEV